MHLLQIWADNSSVHCYAGLWILYCKETWQQRLTSLAFVVQCLGNVAGMGKMFKLIFHVLRKYGHAPCRKLQCLSSNIKYFLFVLFNYLADSYLSSQFGMGSVLSSSEAALVLSSWFLTVRLQGNKYRLIKLTWTNSLKLEFAPSMFQRAYA